MLKMSARGPPARPRALPYILDSAFLHLCEDCCHNTFLYRAVTSKRIKLEIPAWSGFEGLEKIFPTVMWFFYLNFFSVEISAFLDWNIWLARSSCQRFCHLAQPIEWVGVWSRIGLWYKCSLSKKNADSGEHKPIFLFSLAFLWAELSRISR